MWNCQSSDHRIRPSLLGTSSSSSLKSNRTRCQPNLGLSCWLVGRQVGWQEIGQKRLKRPGKLPLEQPSKASVIWYRGQTFWEKADFLAQLDQFDSIVVAYEESAKEGETAALLQAVTGLEKGAKLVLYLWSRRRSITCRSREVLKLKDVLAGLGPRIFVSRNSPAVCQLLVYY